MLWILIGGTLVASSLLLMALRRKRGEKHVDNDLSRLLDWPMVITGILVMVPTWFWWDFIIGIVVVILWEVWKWVKAHRERAELDLATVKVTAKQGVR